MTQTERAQMLDRFTRVDTWCRMMYSHMRSQEHVAELSILFLKTADKQTRTIFKNTLLLDTQCVLFWSRNLN